MVHSSNESASPLNDLIKKSFYLNSPTDEIESPIHSSLRKQFQSSKSNGLYQQHKDSFTKRTKFPLKRSNNKLNVNRDPNRNRTNSFDWDKVIGGNNNIKPLPYNFNGKIILGSSSCSRQKILKAMGSGWNNFTLKFPNVCESTLMDSNDFELHNNGYNDKTCFNFSSNNHNLDPLSLPLKIAQAKSASILNNMRDDEKNQPCLLITADQLVFLRKENNNNDDHNEKNGDHYNNCNNKSHGTHKGISHNNIYGTTTGTTATTLPTPTSITTPLPPNNISTSSTTIDNNYNIKDGICGINAKPVTRVDAANYLRSYSNETVYTSSSVVVVNTQTGATSSHISTASVTFNAISEENINNILNRGRVYSSSGAFAIADDIELFNCVNNIQGNLSSVLGLDHEALMDCAEEVLGSGVDVSSRTGNRRNNSSAYNGDVGTTTPLHNSPIIVYDDESTFYLRIRL